MYKVKNAKTGKFIRDGITGLDLVFNNDIDAKKFAESQEYYSSVKATAWNSIRSAKYLVIAL